MPRNMSFMLTTEQVRRREKTVTRRLGWRFLKVGHVVNACVKCQGLKPGEKIERICEIRITNVRREPINRMARRPRYGRVEASLEGFPELSGAEFVRMFCTAMNCNDCEQVTRIEFEYLD